LLEQQATVGGVDRGVPMLIVSQHVEVLPFDAVDMMKRLELIGRTAYRSEANITQSSADEFIRRLIYKGHESVLEHGSITVRMVVDRGIQQELTRHRIGSYTIESTRYCNYEKKGLRFILPHQIQDDPVIRTGFEEHLRDVEDMYSTMMAFGIRPENARDVLPLCLASTVVATYNLRTWRHILKQRYVGETGVPHPKMVELMSEIRGNLVALLPAVFEDIKERLDGR